MAGEATAVALTGRCEAGLPADIGSRRILPSFSGRLQMLGGMVRMEQKDCDVGDGSQSRRGEHVVTFSDGSIDETGRRLVIERNTKGGLHNKTPS